MVLFEDKLNLDYVCDMGTIRIISKPRDRLSGG